jgi:hypothetical protein
MNQEEASIADDLASAIKALNAALERASEAGLDVRVDYQIVEEFGKHLARRVFFADVSKLAFVKRVG